MAKPTLQTSITSCGIYDNWDEVSKDLPKIKKFTTEVPAEIDIEFGYIINIKKGKGKKITFCIYHPDIPDKNGIVMAPFSDDVYIRDNNWNFYLGDTIWAPIHDKIGNWRMTITCEGQIIADETFAVNEPDDFLEAKFWKRAGY